MNRVENHLINAPDVRDAIHAYVRSFDISNCSRWLRPFIRLQMMWIIIGLIDTDADRFFRGVPHFAFGITWYGRVFISTYIPADAPDNPDSWRPKPGVTFAKLCSPDKVAWFATGESIDVRRPRTRLADLRKAGTPAACKCILVPS